MDRPLVGKRPTFHREKPRNNSYRVLMWLGMITLAVWFLLQIERGEVGQLFLPTPTPTRVSNSYIQEAQAYFEAGLIDDPNTDRDAIDTYRYALQEDPQNARVWAELARIQTYSSSLLSTNEQKRARLQEAREAIDQAVAIDPDDSTAHAIRAFVLDWSSYYYEPDEASRLLTEAYDESVRSIQLDPNNGLALAFYAEVLLDQQNWSQAEQVANQAVEMTEGTPAAMDAYRVRATVYETLGRYRDAIGDYEQAATITPNLTFLYIRIGVNYRYLALQSNSQVLYDQALFYFDKAVSINSQIGVKDPLPYIAIAKTYSQMGQFFIASRNAERALSLDPADPNSYGQLGITYFKARNYESSLYALRCAVQGCQAADNVVLQRLMDENPDWGIEAVVSVEALPLETIEIAYYYAEYGQVLAYLSRPQANQCAEAIQVLAKVRQSYGSDVVLMEIADGSEAVCRRLGGSQGP